MSKIINLSEARKNDIKNSKGNEDYLTKLHTFHVFSEKTRMEISKQLKERLHKRIEVSSCYSGIDEYSFIVYIYEYNNFDYFYVDHKFKPELSAKEYVDTIANIYNDLDLRERYMSYCEIDFREKLFLTWVQSTETGKYYSLTPDGVVNTKLTKHDFVEFDEIYVQDFTATYNKDECILSSNEEGTYVLNSKGIEIVN